MIELVATIILISSLAGMGVILFRKIPVLRSLSEAPSPQLDWRKLSLKVTGKIRNSAPFRDFSTETFLQKILSKIRILTLKTENKTSNWLQRLRERSQKKKSQEEDHYWEEIKKSTKNK